ncbi:hypothetical protein ABTL21_19950, partial [Acinetobacter baumannii]
QELPLSPAGYPKVFIYRLTGLLCHFEADRSASFLLANSGTVGCVAGGSNVIDTDCHHITAAKLTVDRKIEKGEVANA